jgi:HAD superfamily hydrolase (TIGR01509 family)
MPSIKAVVFDLDGVLVNSRMLHFETFRDALHSVKPDIFMTWAEHEKDFDGLSTKLKIKKAIEKGILTESDAVPLFEKKQALTIQRIAEFIKPRESLKLLLQNLKDQGIHLACASNSIRNTLDESLRLLNITQFFDKTYANEDVAEAKPSPEIYMKAMSELNVEPSCTLIVEDSHPGRKAAYDSGAHVLEVEDAEDVTQELFNQTLNQIKLEGKVLSRHVSPIATQPWSPDSQRKINIVIPMAGEGSRFKVAGYTEPKPFIPVGGKPMIRWVIENMLPKEIPNEELHVAFHLIVRKAHLDTHKIASLFTDLSSNVSFTEHVTDGLTEGAACSVLLASDKIDNKDPLIIVNSDQFLEWKSDSFYKCLLNPAYDGNILTFYQPDENDKKWSYAKITDDNLVTQVAEKVWISPYATVGLYGWKRGSDFVKYAKQMISKNIRVNNEFYVCPVYNEAIEDGEKIRVTLCSGMWGLGVPEDLEKFRREYIKELQ